ncbi:glutaredoxin [Paracoccidioides brasiliensis]|nr:glutaredoxin [Paracoccidioides brasiliensis]
MSAVKTKVESIIADHCVVVFSKSYCSYSRASKALLTELGIPFFALELDQIKDGTAIQHVLEEITSQRTVPNIFIGKKHIGGNSDLQARKAELPTLLRAAEALKANA